MKLYEIHERRPCSSRLTIQLAWGIFLWEVVAEERKRESIEDFSAGPGILQFRGFEIFQPLRNDIPRVFDIRRVHRRSVYGGFGISGKWR